MEIFTVNEAKQHFGEVIDKALQTPVSITNYGRPSVVVTSENEYQDLLRIKHEHLREEAQKGFNEIDRGDVSKRKNEDIANAVLQRYEKG